VLTSGHQPAKASHSEGCPAAHASHFGSQVLWEGVRAPAKLTESRSVTGIAITIQRLVAGDDPGRRTKLDAHEPTASRAPWSGAPVALCRSLVGDAGDGGCVGGSDAHQEHAGYGVATSEFLRSVYAQVAPAQQGGPVQQCVGLF